MKTYQKTELPIKPFRIVIPARYNSSRFPGKPLVMIGDKTLIQHVYARACASAATEIIVATDDARIATSAAAVGANICMTSSNHQSGSERIAEVITQLNWSDETCIVNMQGDEPCIPASLINQVAVDLMANPDAVMATLATKIDNWDTVFDPNVVKVVIDTKGYALYFSRAAIPWYRQEFNSKLIPFPTTINIYRHLGLYAYRAGFLSRYVNWLPAPIEQAESLEQLRVLWYGERIHVSLTDNVVGPGVDVPSDVLKVQELLVTN